jgi:hypothetical protein
MKHKQYLLWDDQYKAVLKPLFPVSTLVVTHIFLQSQEISVQGVLKKIQV